MAGSIGSSAFAFESYNHWDITKKYSHSGCAFIYGAVSSLKFSAVQLAKYIDFNVIAVAPKKHKELLESVSITQIVDYHHNDWVEQVRRIGGDDIAYAYDTISSAETVAQVVKAVSTTKPVKVNISLPRDAQLTNLPENIALDCPLGYLITDPFGSLALYVSMVSLTFLKMPLPPLPMPTSF